MKTIDRELIDPVIEPGIEKLHRVMRTLASGLPMGSEVFLSLFESPMESRKQKWMIQVTEEINKLILRDNINIEELMASDEFVSKFMHISNISLRTHEKIKLNALKNALINTASSRTLNEHKRTVFLHLIDTFTEWHIKLLQIYRHPEKFLSSSDCTHNKGDFGSVKYIKTIYPELNGEDTYILSLISDLMQKELIILSSKTEVHMNPESKVMAKTTSSLGDEFLDFISDDHSEA
ncbi:hypothetical protein ACOA5R_003549 [Vibrio cholerae]